MTQQPTGVLPQSTALAEASPESLSDLMSRDPEGYQRQDLDTIIDELRKQRQRIVASGGATVAQAKSGGKSTSTTASAEDLGL